MPISGYLNRCSAFPSAAHSAATAKKNSLLFPVPAKEAFVVVVVGALGGAQPPTPRKSLSICRQELNCHCHSRSAFPRTAAQPGALIPPHHSFAQTVWSWECNSRRCGWMRIGKEWSTALRSRRGIQILTKRFRHFRVWWIAALANQSLCICHRRAIRSSSLLILPCLPSSVCLDSDTSTYSLLLLPLLLSPIRPWQLFILPVIEATAADEGLIIYSAEL